MALSIGTGRLSTAEPHNPLLRWGEGPTWEGQRKARGSPWRTERRGVGPGRPYWEPLGALASPSQLCLGTPVPVIITKTQGKEEKGRVPGAGAAGCGGAHPSLHATPRLLLWGRNPWVILAGRSAPCHQRQTRAPLWKEQTPAENELQLVGDTEAHVSALLSSTSCWDPEYVCAGHLGVPVGEGPLGAG